MPSVHSNPDIGYQCWDRLARGAPLKYRHPLQFVNASPPAVDTQEDIRNRPAGGRDPSDQIQGASMPEFVYDRMYHPLSPLLEVAQQVHLCQLCPRHPAEGLAGIDQLTLELVIHCHFIYSTCATGLGSSKAQRILKISPLSSVWQDMASFANSDVWNIGGIG